VTVSQGTRIVISVNGYGEGWRVRAWQDCGWNYTLSQTWHHDESAAKRQARFLLKSYPGAVVLGVTL